MDKLRCFLKNNAPEVFRLFDIFAESGVFVILPLVLLYLVVDMESIRTSFVRALNLFLLQIDEVARKNRRHERSHFVLHF